MRTTIHKFRTGRGALVALALTTLALTAACASTQPAATQLTDTEITTKVESKLTADPEVNPFNIDVDTNEGVVRLSGTVKKEYARAEAEKLARDTEGVRRVINEIQLGERPFGERVDDAAITAKIKAKLAADPEVNPFNINVDSDAGVVTLTGRVKTKAAKQEAGKHASNTEGVREVRNRLEVGEMMEEMEGSSS